MKTKIEEDKKGNISVDPTCEYCGLPITETSVEFGMDCANHCSQKKYEEAFPVDNVIPFDKPAMSDDPSTITFWVSSESRFPILELGPKDEIRVRGRLIERDQEVVDALRKFILETGYIETED